jgi:PPM family protein phosphatase
MTSDDLLLAAALGVLCAGVAYALGRRTRQAAAVPVPSNATAPSSAPPSSSSSSPPSSSSSSSSPPSSSSQPASSTSSSAPAAKEEAQLEKLHYEEDEAVDPTRVGPGAAAAGATRQIYQPPIKKIAYDEDANADEPTKAHSFFLIHATAETDTGLRRKRNEDAVLVLEPHHLFAIADGMGGYQGGQLASQTAVKTIGAAWTASAFEGPPHEGVPADATNLARSIQMANAAILELSRRKPELEGMGTTVCAARFSPNKRRLFIGHVGDSRCYRMRGGVLTQMTADHTMADFGVTGPESAHLSRAVGIWPTVPIDILTAVPAPGDVYLLCSDGLTKMLTDESIGAVLRGEDDPKTAVDRLILFANARGGKDNITVILIRVVPPPH